MYFRRSLYVTRTRFRNQPRSGGRLCFFTSNLPNGNFTVSPRFKASVISSRTAFTTDSASLRLNSFGFHADLSTPRRFGEIAFTRSRRVKMALVGWTTSLATSRLPSPPLCFRTSDPTVLCDGSNNIISYAWRIPSLPSAHIKNPPRAPGRPAGSYITVSHRRPR
jgi:hypothetical protein